MPHLFIDFPIDEEALDDFNLGAAEERDLGRTRGKDYTDTEAVLKEN